MNASEIIAALDLPEASRVDHRVPKKLLLENGAPTAADKRYINEGVEELWWVAAIKPTTAAVPEYRDDVREYLEIAVLRLTLRARSKVSRLVELVHRSVPYPVLLVTAGECSGVSAVHKRRSQGEAGKTVLDGEVVAFEWHDAEDEPYRSEFGDALALGRQPQSTLYALYQGWIDTLLAMQAARLTGAFRTSASAEHAGLRHAALRECARLDTEIARLRAAATKEKQIPRLVELNLELKRVEVARAAAREKL